MEKTPLMSLVLHTPLFYAKTADLPQKICQNEEFLLFFELNAAQSRSIEPDPEKLLGPLIFSGRKTGDSEMLLKNMQDYTSGNTQYLTLLPKGNYLFMQRRSVLPEALDNKGWLDLAVEQQKDGLWERYKPESSLYVRFLYEDGSFVTQLFRSLATDAASHKQKPRRDDKNVSYNLKASTI